MHFPNTAWRHKRLATENPAMTTVISKKPRIETRRNQLEHIKIFPTVVADTGDFETIRKFVADIAKLETFIARTIN
jgi:hypothetical protein